MPQLDGHDAIIIYQLLVARAHFRSETKLSDCPNGENRMPNMSEISRDQLEVMAAAGEEATQLSLCDTQQL